MLLARAPPDAQHAHLETLKRQLLQNSDWASISASRPLELSFASVQETKQFGKRRRLNDTDRRRLAVTQDHQPLPRLFESCRPDWRAPEQEICMEGLEIQINGRPVGLPTNETPEMIVQRASPSSGLDREDQSMSPPLDLGTKTTVSNENPWKLNSDRLSLRPTHNPSPVGTRRENSSHTPRAKDSQSCGRGNFRFAESESLPSTPHLLRRRLSGRSASRDTVPYPANVSLRSLEALSPVRLDLGLSSTHPLDHELYRSSPVETAASPTPLIDYASNFESPGWLPQPQRHTQCDNPIPNHLESRCHARVETSNSLSPITKSPKGGGHDVSVKIFGQLVRMQELDG